MAAGLAQTSVDNTMCLLPTYFYVLDGSLQIALCHSGPSHNQHVADRCQAPSAVSTQASNVPWFTFTTFPVMTGTYLADESSLQLNEPFIAAATCSDRQISCPGAL